MIFSKILHLSLSKTHTSHPNLNSISSCHLSKNSCKVTSKPYGVVAQLGERYNGIVEVRGSIPLGSTIRFKLDKMEVVQSSYQAQAFKTMEAIADALENYDDLEIDFDGNALQIHLSDGKQYLINFHGVMNQLWLSSPFSGAHHFDYKDGQWKSTRMDINLNMLLETELEKQLGYSVDL